MLSGAVSEPGLLLYHPHVTAAIERPTAYDVNFGKEIGSAGVILLDEGFSGVTVVEVHDGRIRYVPTTEAIVQRFVSLDDVTFYEQMDVCFGRNPQVLEEVKGPVERFM